MYVIGTAGHVDHGKSALVKALTGIDPDRLREEKEREMTIDLGFAWLTLPNGQEVSIVDVPGHERFVKNMLAGVGGIDLALLVIAADEGVMPQTREHLAILDLLDVRQGVVAISKKDLADGDLLSLVEADAAEVIAGTTLDGSPIVSCSALTGEGLTELVEAIEKKLAETPPKRDLGRPRLPIDRAFTVAGFGTVVTGTLVDGSFRVGQEVEIVPGGLRSRIRGLQSHQRKLDEVAPGCRLALNLAGLSPRELRRGMVVTTPGWLRPTTAIDVRLRAVNHLPRPIRHSLQVSFHSGSSEVGGRVLLLDRNELPAGQTAWAQIRLNEPLPVAAGDFFVIRSPNDTLGGGKVVDVHVRRHRRFHQPTLETLEKLDRGSPEDMLLVALSRLEPCELSQLTRHTELAPDQVLAAAAGLVEEGRALVLGAPKLGPTSTLYSAQGFAALTARAKDILAAFHRQRPLRRGLAREELRSRLGLEPRAFDAVVATWAARGDIREDAGTLALPEHTPSLSPAEQAAADAFLASLRANPYAPPASRLPDSDLLGYLEEKGEIVRVTDNLAFTSDAYAEMTARIVEHLKAQGTITLAQVRDMFATSRRYAQALLEHLDEQRITRRVGDERVLRRSEAT
ncbi:MAG: selenocysteine-specific translation elongation factor [Dehalococcoidia bacterium]